MNKTELIEKFKETRMELLIVVKDSATNDGTKELYGDWRLSDLLNHLTGWSQKALDCVDSV